jgi:hypothetical protein
MLNLFKWRQLLAIDFFLLSFGGSSSSDSSTKASSSTSTAISTSDKRAVASENANAITGNNNLTNRTNLTSVSNSGNTTTYATDFGSVGAALSGITQIGSKAIDAGQMSINGAVDVLKQQTANNLSTTAAVVGLAKDYGANTLSNSRDVLGLASSTIGTISGLATSTANIAAGAYQNQADTATGNRTVVLAGLAVVAVVGAAFIFKKG